MADADGSEDGGRASLSGPKGCFSMSSDILWDVWVREGGRAGRTIHHGSTAWSVLSGGRVRLSKSSRKMDASSKSGGSEIRFWISTATPPLSPGGPSAQSTAKHKRSSLLSRPSNVLSQKDQFFKTMWWRSSLKQLRRHAETTSRTVRRGKRAAAMQIPAVEACRCADLRTFQGPLSFIFAAFCAACCADRGRPQPFDSAMQLTVLMRTERAICSCR